MAGHDWSVSEHNAEIEEKLVAQIKSCTFLLSDPGSVIGFLRNTSLFCDANGLNEEQSCDKLPFLINKTAYALLNKLLIAENIDRVRSRLANGGTSFMIIYPLTDSQRLAEEGD